MLGALGDGGAYSRHVKTRVEEVRTFLEENLTRGIDIPGVARATSLSPFYLTRIFKARYGVPPYRYLIRLRIQYASDLLRDSALSVTQVSHRSGFNSLSHLHHHLPPATGMSPLPVPAHHRCRAGPWGSPGDPRSEVDCLANLPRRVRGRTDRNRRRS